MNVQSVIFYGTFQWLCPLSVCFSDEEDEEDELTHESRVTQEMLEEHRVRMLTREVMELIGKFFFFVP